MKQLPKIMVAPNGATKTKSDHPAVPVSIEETVATAKLCHDEGAAAIHAHVRDGDGKHILDAGLYRELLSEMASKVPTMNVQITTEAVGRYTASEQRQLVLDVMPEMVSVGMREMMSDDDDRAARAFYHFALEADLAVQHIVYEAGELERLFALVESGIVPAGPLQLMFVLGRYTEGQQSDPRMLQPFLDVLQNQNASHQWAVCAFGSGETACLEAALSAGGVTRVGFENSLFNADGTRAKDNAERVREIAALKVA